MNGVVFRHPLRKGVPYGGYRPVVGQLRDAEGRMILEHVYIEEPRELVPVVEPPAPEAERPKTIRGVQGALI